jgi:phosphate transport system permease protein
MKGRMRIYDKVNTTWMLICLGLVILLPFVLGIGLYFKSQWVLQDRSLVDVLFSTDWRPMQGKFGFLPFITGSLYVTLLALLIAAPICLLTAIYLTQYARKRVLQLMQPVIDILAGLPSVVYGVWGILMIVPFISKTLAPALGMQSSGYTLLAGALVLAIMIIPFILNIMIEVLKTIPEELTETSMSLGSTRWQTIKFVLLRKAFPGIISALVFGLSRAFGETIAVLMVIGNVAKVPESLLDPAYPLPALIANNYGEMLSIPRYDSALMLAALILFVIVIIFNLASRMTISRLETRHG